MRHIVIGTAGHIDHGKTSLVKALTGIDTDRLTEEKQRGISIELGFAPWQIDASLEAGLVDVPGHERLVRTMVAGAGGMDLALLVVAADDGFMPQSREHLDVLNLLGVPHGITVITKCDLVDEDLIELVQAEIEEATASTVFANAPMICVSTKTQQGISELRDAVRKQIAQLAPKTPLGPIFLPLDRVFTKTGHGTVATGTCLRGTLSVGDMLQALGDNEQPIEDLKVRSLQSLGTNRNETTAGMRTAVNLNGKGASQLKRGMVLCPPNTFATTHQCVAWVRVLPHGKALTEETLTAHIGTTERAAQVIPLGAQELAADTHGGVLLRFDRPISCFASQHLVLRRSGAHGQGTIAGGTILDPHPPEGKGSVSLASSQLSGLRGSAEDRITALAYEARAKGLSEGDIIKRLASTEERRAIDALEKRGILTRVSSANLHWVHTGYVEKIVDRLVTLVEKHHKQNPLSPGMGEAEVPTQLSPPDQSLAPIVIERAATSKRLVRHNQYLTLPDRQPSLDEQAKSLLNTIVKQIRNAALTPPSEQELCNKLKLTTKRTQELLNYLCQQGQLAKVATGLYYDVETLTDMQTRVTKALIEQESLTPAELKPIMGSVSRKWAIPLLEYLDRQHITIRSGQVRKLHPAYKSSPKSI